MWTILPGSRVKSLYMRVRPQESVIVMFFVKNWITELNQQRQIIRNQHDLNERLLRNFSSTIIIDILLIYCYTFVFVTGSDFSILLSIQLFSPLKYLSLNSESVSSDIISCHTVLMTVHFVSYRRAGSPLDPGKPSLKFGSSQKDGEIGVHAGNVYRLPVSHRR